MVDIGDDDENVNQENTVKFQNIKNGKNAAKWPSLMHSRKRKMEEQKKIR